MSRSNPSFSTAPLALASDGTILVNVAQLVTEDDLEAVIDAAKKHQGPIFIGVPLTKAETKSALARMDDAAAEIAARIGGRRGRRA